MKTKAFSLAAVLILTLSGLCLAGPSKTYQVTGPILEMNDQMVAVQKGKDRWEITRDASTKAQSELKVGDKVTITYTMTATEIEAKPMKGDKSAKAEGTHAEASPSPKK